MLSESFKIRLKQLAGIIKEDITVGPGGGDDIKGLAFGDQIPGDQQFQYAVTYEIITPESSENGDAEERGWEVEYTTDELENIISLGRHTYGVSEPSSSIPQSHMWWSSASPVSDRDYFEKSEEKYYSLHIKHVDGSDIDDKEASFINKLLTGDRWSWDSIDNVWIKK